MIHRCGTLYKKSNSKIKVLLDISMNKNILYFIYFNIALLFLLHFQDFYLCEIINLSDL